MKHNILNEAPKAPIIAVAAMVSLTGCAESTPPQPLESTRPSVAESVSDVFSPLTEMTAQNEGVCSDPLGYGLSEVACLSLPSFKGDFRSIPVGEVMYNHPDALVASIDPENGSGLNKLSPIWRAIISSTIDNPFLKEASADHGVGVKIIQEDLPYPLYSPVYNNETNSATTGGYISIGLSPHKRGEFYQTVGGLEVAVDHESVHALMQGYDEKSPEFQSFAATYEGGLKSALEDIRTSRLPELRQHLDLAKRAIGEDLESGYITQSIADSLSERIESFRESLQEKDGLSTMIDRGEVNKDFVVSYLDPNKLIVGDLASEIEVEALINSSALAEINAMTMEMRKFLGEEYMAITEGSLLNGMISENQGHPYDNPGETAASMITIAKNAPEVLIKSIVGNPSPESVIYAKNYVTIIDLMRVNDPHVVEQVPNLSYVYDEMVKIDQVN